MMSTLLIAAAIGPAPTEVAVSEPCDATNTETATETENHRADHVDPQRPRTRWLESAPFDLAGGGARIGDWAIEISGGWPWQRLRAQVGLGHTLTAIVEFETALGRRFRPAVGLGMRWLDRPHARLSGELMLAWLFVPVPEIRKLGPQAELRLRLAFPVRRVAPYVVLGTRHTLLTDRTILETAAGRETELHHRHNWTAWASVGLAIAIHDSVGIEVGIDYPWVDYPTIPIPGIHAGVLWGDIQRRPR